MKRKTGKLLNNQSPRAKKLSRRHALKLCVSSTASSIWLSSCCAGLQRESYRRNPPNIILIMADDLSAREIGCYGADGNPTPVLDAMAAQGVQFRTCWATPLCSPSRAEIMTGRYGFRTGWYHNQLKKNTPLPENQLVFSQMLKQVGYATAIAGKWQLPGTASGYGFDEHCLWQEIPGQFKGLVEPGEGNWPGRPSRYWHPAIVHNGKQLQTRPRDYGPDLVVDFICDFISRKRTQPFLVYYPMILPHKTWDFDRQEHGYVCPPRLNSERERIRGKGEPSLKANVNYIDHLVGRILNHLESAGLEKDTVILFTADNGTSGYGKGQTNLERGQLVPMIVHGSTRVQPLGACDVLVDFSDILPTLAELCGVSLPEDYRIDGHSFAPLLQGKPFQQREWIFSYLAGDRMLRSQRWLLDGAGHFYDCGDNRSGEGYPDVTGSTSAEVMKARKRFDEILSRLPAPEIKHPIKKPASYK
jgi:arylsulfatase A-like enzyme